MADRTAAERFIRDWAVALIFSLAVLYFELDALAESLHGFGWSTLKSETAAAWLGHPASAASSPRRSAMSHGSPHIVAAAVQIFAAVAISWMWFGAFRILGRARAEVPQPGAMPTWLARITWPRLKGFAERMYRGWWAVAMASIVVLLFAFTMHQAYQPAVLVMALIAIIVAAEHYSGLREAVDDLRKVEGFTSRLAEDAGLSHFVHDVYERYAAANQIHAVVRMHDIDPVWWSLVKDRSGDPWDGYIEDARRLSQPKDATAERRNLARALRRDRGALKACFVTDLPMPGSAEWERRLKPDDGEPLFGDLLGFAWQWIVLQEVQKNWKQVECRAWVSRPLCWVHATDRVVFQVLRREPRSRSAVLVVADREGLSLSAGAIETYRGMVQWANEEVQRYAERGCSAEDYLLAVLRYAAVLGSKQGDAGLVASGHATDDLHYLLELLGARTWIDSPGRKSESTFSKFDDTLVSEASANVFVRALVTMFPRQSRVSVRDLWGRLA